MGVKKKTENKPKNSLQHFVKTSLTLADFCIIISAYPDDNGIIFSY